MTNKSANAGRRRFLTAMTSAVGVAGAVGIAVPFVGSWNPSAKAKAAGAPVKQDISSLEPGQMVTVEWRGKPVFILRRTAEQLEDLVALEGQLKDPKSTTSKQPVYIESDDRAINAEYFVVLGLCTHLGCSPKQISKLEGKASMGADWLGGFFCPCHGSKFDLAGRVYKGVPASDNLEIPPYTFDSASTIIIGVDGGAA